MNDTPQFHSWNKVEAGHYVYKTDDGYIATVQKDDYYPLWNASATSPSGRVADTGYYDEDSMAEARKSALHMVKDLIQQCMSEFKGKWDFVPGCMCAKCENFWNMLADCMGDARSMEEDGASPDRPVKGWRLNHRAVTA